VRTLGIINFPSVSCFFASVLKAEDVVFCEKRNCILVLYGNLMSFLESHTHLARFRV
jgi:hypothetical protein